MFSFDLESLKNTLIEKSMQLLLLFILFFLFEKTILKAIKKLYKNYIKTKFQSEQRKLTLYKLFESIIQYTFYFCFGYALLSILGFPVATLIAGAGIAGLVIGLGAQSFINDLVNGFFILIERQFDVNDLITIGNATGRVKNISLRITTLESLDGSIYYIRNKEINSVNNLSKYSRRTLVNLFFKNTSDVNKIKEIITQINQEELKTNSHLTKAPVILGLNTAPNGNLYYSIALYTHDYDAIQIQDEFYTKYINALSKQQIELFK